MGYWPRGGPRGCSIGHIRYVGPYSNSEDQSQMGFAVTWLAVKGASREIILSSLGLVGTERFEDRPGAGLSGATLPDGWYLVWSSTWRERFIAEETLGPLSRDCHVVSCAIEEHVMYSYATGYWDGKQSWSVAHDAQLGLDHLDVTGRPPRKFEAIRHGNRLKQDKENAGPKEVDFIFETPLDLAQHLTGFKHDAPLPPGPDFPFEELRSTRKQSWFRRLLGMSD